MTYMRRPETKSDPSTVERLPWKTLETPDIMRPECESRACQTKTTSDSLGHGFECTLAVTAPVDWELLASCSGGSCEQGSGIRASLGLDGFEYYFVVNVCVVARISESPLYGNSLVHLSVVVSRYLMGARGRLTLGHCHRGKRHRGEGFSLQSRS
jgi:hypothetical protein